MLESATASHKILHELPDGLSRLKVSNMIVCFSFWGRGLDGIPRKAADGSVNSSQGQEEPSVPFDKDKSRGVAVTQQRRSTLVVERSDLARIP